jgi:hypothetical protein
LTSKEGIRISAALAITACALLFVPAAASAATGSISGTVTAASGGAALEGVEVCAYEVEEEVEGGCALTSPSGQYTISSLVPGEYKVEFWPHREGLNYVTQYYNHKSTFATAEAVTVISGGTATGVNAQLQVGGLLTGTLTDAATHAALPGVFVCALEPTIEEFLCGQTDAGGQYTIAGLPSSSFYRVEFGPEFEEQVAPGTYITQYYSGKSTFAEANPVAVTAPATTAGIDAALARRPAAKVPTISVPPVVTPAPVAPPPRKPIACKKGFKKKTVKGKARCVRKAKRHHHRRHR